MAALALAPLAAVDAGTDGIDADNYEEYVTLPVYEMLHGGLTFGLQESLQASTDPTVYRNQLI